ncbi:hypothetical protein GOV09_02590 [Candidatus Woesearchaeota archaeon]|nr:hypothetical protein [Candidatus Woesearchaeota archaeon]
MSELSPAKMRRFIKHLCIITNKYYDREQAQLDVNEHVRKMKDSDVDHGLSRLNKKINKLLDKELQIAELGNGKKLSPSMKKALELLKKELSLSEGQRKKLLRENSVLRNHLEGLQDVTEEVVKHKTKSLSRMKKIEGKVNLKYRSHLLYELHDKVDELEDQYNKLSRDKSQDPARLYKVEQRLKLYKKKLKLLS